jgi:FAD/FMN-containing dehydrogenase
LAKHETKFAVRSGGRNYIPGFASVNESGVLVSLSQLDSITLSEDQTAIQVGSGARWQAVYEALAPNGLMAMGAREGFVGVGGLILGGKPPSVLPIQAVYILTYYRRIELFLVSIRTLLRYRQVI